MISIVIPNYNGRKLLEKNLPAIVQAANVWKGKTEIIVVDDASEDGSAAFVRSKFPKIKVLVNNKNQRFARACNRGVSFAKGKIIILLNNDVVPRKDFIQPLMEDFRDQQVFAVGCLEESQIKGKSVYFGRALGEFKRGFLVHRRAENQEGKSTLWAASGSAAYRKDIWNKLGGLDPLFYPAYMEDTDISYRALKSGYKVLFESKSLVYHQHETTNIQVFGAKGLKKAAFKNQIIFVWKNITDLDLLINHFLWLPYHLVFSSIRSEGLFLQAFIQASIRLPAIFKARFRAGENFNIPDSEILKHYA